MTHPDRSVPSSAMARAEDRITMDYPAEIVNPPTSKRVLKATSRQAKERG